MTNIKKMLSIKNNYVYNVKKFNYLIYQTGLLNQFVTLTKLQGVFFKAEYRVLILHTPRQFRINIRYTTNMQSDGQKGHKN